MFDVLADKPDLLILGTGSSVSLIGKRARSYLHSLGIQVDAMDTKNAASCYNMLSQEGRRVAAALLVPNA